MKQFIKFLFASCLGVILAIFVVGLILFGIGASIAGSQNKDAEVKPNTVLELDFKNPVPEQTNNIERDIFSLEEEDILGLQDIVANIEHAREDKNIKGIFLKTNELSVGGLASAAVVRDALEDFTNSGKFIYAYSEWYSQGSYYLASSADEVYLHPMGLIDFRGFAAVIPFFKEMLDNIGVKFEAFYAGDFKSATEPYRRVDMSEENKLQLREFLNEIYLLYLGEIADSRNTTISALDSVSDNMLLRNAEAALELGFVDKLGYEDEVIAELKKRIGLEENEKLNTVSLEEYHTSWHQKKDYSVKDKIAIVYAEGTIVDGSGEIGQIGDKDYTKIIKKIADDDDIKAIVVRVNSPGGSGMASENIWRALNLAKEKGKKVVVSMGDYAASGGYYISCAADSIFAESETLTGSIGVFNLFPDVSGLLEDKLSIHMDTVKTGNYSAGFNPTLGLSDGERSFIQNFVNEMYERFLTRVGDARGKTREEVHAVAQGRIWSGRKAVELGLADKIGGLDESVVAASSLAGLEKYRLVEYPKPKDAFQQLLEKFTGGNDDAAVKVLEKELNDWGISYTYIKELKASKGIQFRLPFILRLK